MLYKYAMTNGATVDIITNKPLTLDQLQGLVGGNIEHVRGDYYGIPEGEIVANEEGLLIGLPPNPALKNIVGNAVVGKIEQGDDGLDFVGL